MTTLHKNMLFVFFLVISALLVTSPVKAEDILPPPEPGVSNAFCLECHGEAGIYLILGNGEYLDLHIDAEEYAQSVHGESGYACVQCHTTVITYPHSRFSAEDHRDAAAQLYTSCQRCHSGEYALTLDSAHETARIEGNSAAALCSDCHPPHRIQRLTDAQTGFLLTEVRTNIPQICAQCHSLIYEKYLTSVHGAALIEESNTDVPTCIDCHGVHNIENPLTASFRLNSPNICAKCHIDPELMEKYELSTQVLATFVADFHGTTVTLFEKQSSDADTNKPVCFDCHGVHDIKRVDDPEKGLQVRENLLARCQICHPDATSNFPDAWLSHYIPSSEENRIVYLVDLFYKFFIPGVLGGMGILVVLDFTTKLRKRSFRIKLPKLGPISQKPNKKANNSHSPPVSDEEKSLPKTTTQSSGSDAERGKSDDVDPIEQINQEENDD